MHASIHPFIHSFTHSLTHSLTHSFIHSFIHSIIHFYLFIYLHFIALHRIAPQRIVSYRIVLYCIVLQLYLYYGKNYLLLLTDFFASPTPYKVPSFIADATPSSQRFILGLVGPSSLSSGITDVTRLVNKRAEIRDG